MYGFFYLILTRTKFFVGLNMDQMSPSPYPSVEPELKLLIYPGGGGGEGGGGRGRRRGGGGCKKRWLSRGRRPSAPDLWKQLTERYIYIKREISVPYRKYNIKRGPHVFAIVILVPLPLPTKNVCKEYENVQIFAQIYKCQQHVEQ